MREEDWRGSIVIRSRNRRRTDARKATASARREGDPTTTAGTAGVYKLFTSSDCRRQMPLTTADQLTIEKSPSYFVTKTAPARVHELDPGMKLIVVVRDPITRAISGRH